MGVYGSPSNPLMAFDEIWHINRGLSKVSRCQIWFSSSISFSAASRPNFMGHFCLYIIFKPFVLLWSFSPKSLGPFEWNAPAAVKVRHIGFSKKKNTVLWTTRLAMYHMQSVLTSNGFQWRSRQTGSEQDPTQRDCRKIGSHLPLSASQPCILHPEVWTCWHFLFCDCIWQWSSQTGSEPISQQHFHVSTPDWLKTGSEAGCQYCLCVSIPNLVKSSRLFPEGVEQQLSHLTTQECYYNKTNKTKNVFNHYPSCLWSKNWFIKSGLLWSWHVANSCSAIIFEFSKIVSSLLSQCLA